jgi:hypothetical protein
MLQVYADAGMLASMKVVIDAKTGRVTIPVAKDSGGLVAVVFRVVFDKVLSIRIDY